MTGVMLRVQRVVMPSGAESSTLLRDGVVVEPADRFLAHLTAIERSPNTVRAYAHDLRDFFVFLDSRCLEWSGVGLEDLGRFVAWLRLAGEARDGQVTLLPWVEGSVSAATVNRKLSALVSFYEFHQRHGVDVADLLTRWRPGGRGGSWKPFLAHLGSRPERRRAVALRTGRRLPRELSEAEMTMLIDRCTRLRDRFLLSVLRGCGLRAGEALGLRHEDIDARRGLVLVRQRANVNRARAKTWEREVPADQGLIRLYSDYLHEEYGTLDCDYVFVNLWGQPLGHPMSYASVDRLVRRLRARTGIEFTPHQFRHSYATGLQMSRIAFGASFGSSREHPLPAAQRAASRRRLPVGALRVHGDLGLHGPPGSDATMMRLVPMPRVHHDCGCCDRDASGSSWLRRVHHRRSRPAVPGRDRSRGRRAGLGHVTRLSWQPAALVAPGASPPRRRTFLRSPVRPSATARRRTTVAQTWPARVPAADGADAPDLANDNPLYGWADL